MRFKASTVFRVALGGGGLYAVAIGPAAAADFAGAQVAKAPAKPRPPVFTYQGPYTGLNIGGASWRTRQQIQWASVNGLLPGGSPTDPNGNIFPDRYNKRSFRLTFGAQVGYNIQVEKFLLGLEADINSGSSANVLTFQRSGSFQTTSILTSTSSFATSSFVSFPTTTWQSAITSTPTTAYSTYSGSSVSTSLSFTTSYLTTSAPSMSYGSSTVASSAYTTFTTSTTIAGSAFSSGGTTFWDNTTATYQTSSYTSSMATVSYSTLTQTVSTINSFVSTQSSLSTSFYTTSTVASSGYNTFSTSTVSGFLTSTIYTTMLPTTTFQTVSTHSPYGVLGVGRAKIDWINTVRTRFGFVSDRTLFYVTGGLAIGQVSQGITTTLYKGADTYSWQTHKTAVRLGFAVGGGVEHAISDNWSVRAQYVYYNLGTAKHGVVPITSPALNANVSGLARSRVDGFSATFGVNYLFRTQ